MKLLVLCLLFTSCAMFPQVPVKTKVIPQKNFQEKQEEKVYSCLKELMDKMAFNGMKLDLNDISSACKSIYTDERCK